MPAALHLRYIVRVAVKREVILGPVWAEWPGSNGDQESWFGLISETEEKDEYEASLSTKEWASERANHETTKPLCANDAPGIAGPSTEALEE